ncbi:MAG: hypothetical protein IJY12_04305 [Clostridia bacterium]|nr:hypothetical protein [Clostridia bacterium]
MILFANEILADHLNAFRVCTLPPDDRLAPPVASHADMLTFTYGETVIFEREYYCVNERRLTPYISTPAHLALTSLPRSCIYPHDIGLNALLVGDTLFCNARHTAPEILNCGAEIVDVRQGYAACSTLVLSERTIVTADPSIARAAERKGLDVLAIRPGYVRLTGYNTGFIGGATAKIGNTVYFFGDPSSHPDFYRIEEACLREDLAPKHLFDGPLTDLGGVRALK